MAKLGLLAGSCLLCFCAMEVSLRLLGYGAIGTRDGRAAHYVTDEFEQHDVLNSLELRGREVGPKRPGEFRVLVLGDSFTYGLGVADEQTFVARCELLVHGKARDATASPVRFVNGGVGGGPFRQAEWLDAVGLGLEPNLVVLAFFVGNDIYDDRAWREGRAPLPGRAAPRRGLRSSLALDWMWGRLVLVPGIDRLLFRVGLRYTGRGLYLIDQPRQEREAWGQTLAKIGQIAETLERRGIPLLTMIVPTSDQVRFGERRPAGEDYGLPNRILTDYLRERKIPFLDLLPLMERAPEKDRFYYRRDLHWTAAGHDFAATALADRLWPDIAAARP